MAGEDATDAYRAGNRIQVDVTSSNFPRRARNTNRCWCWPP